MGPVLRFSLVITAAAAVCVIIAAAVVLAMAVAASSHTLTGCRGRPRHLQCPCAQGFSADVRSWAELKPFSTILRPRLQQVQEFMRDVSANARHCAVPRRTNSFSSVTITCSPCCTLRKTCGRRCLAPLSFSLLLFSLSELVAAFRALTALAVAL